MKYYTSSRYTGKSKRKRIIRIVLICSLVLGIFVGLAVLGNLLGARVSWAQSELSDDFEDPAVQTGGSASYVYERPPRKKEFSATVRCVPLGADVLADTEAVKAAVLDASRAGQGLSVTVSHADGPCFSFSPTEDGTDLVPLSLLSEAVSAAGMHDVPLSATVYTTHSAERDVSLVRALSAMGISETVLCGLTDGTISAEQTYSLLVRLEVLRDAVPQMTVGLALPPEAFTDAASAVHLDTLASYYDFLLIDLSRADTEQYETYLKDMLHTHYGSLAYYGLAVLIDGNADLQAAEEIFDSARVSTVRCLY